MSGYFGSPAFKGQVLGKWSGQFTGEAELPDTPIDEPEDAEQTSNEPHEPNK